MYICLHMHFIVNIFGKSKEPSGQPNLPLMHYSAVYADIKYNIYVVCSSELIINMTLVKV